MIFPARRAPRAAHPGALAALLLLPAVAGAQPPPGSAPPGAYPPGSYGPGTYGPGSYGPVPTPASPGPYQPLTDEAYEEQIRLTKQAIKDADRRDDEEEVRRLKEHYDRLKRGRKELRERTSERYSTGMMVGGIVMAGTGLAASITGLTLALVGVGTGEERLEVAGVITASSGVALLGGGIPLLLVGAKRVPRGRGAALEPRPGQAALLASPSGATLRVRF